jgi:hypothetical protein
MKTRTQDCSVYVEIPHSTSQFAPYFPFWL